MKTTIKDFDFHPVGTMHYRVTYTHPKTGKKYQTTLFKDVWLMKVVRQTASQKEIELLRKIVQNQSHLS